jgi:para-aminobenzoate synthetase component 1
MIRSRRYLIIPSDIDDAFAFYRKVRVLKPHTALLESLGPCRPDSSRFSFVGACPAETLCTKDNRSFVSDLRTGKTELVPTWLEVLDKWTCLFTEDGQVATPLQTGAIGYIGYEARHEFERLARHIPGDTSLPDVYLVRYDGVLVFDRVTGRAQWAVTPGYEEECAALERAFLDAREAAPGCGFQVPSDIGQDFEKAGYTESVNRAIEYIRAGDIFQANITVRFNGCFCGDVLPLYERLRLVTPNPFFALLDFPAPVISTSPERFFSVRSGEVLTCPVKGTATCTVGGVDQHDVLRRSEKNLAENVMITDLVRNDIGRVCRKGSVQVMELCAVRKFNNLYHLESTVRGELRSGTTLSALLRAVFPGGSITGAPKIRAMDIIEELENVRRGPYCGAIGFLGCDGWIDTSIAIRIIYFDEGRFYFHAGGAIVVDSTAEDEYQELIAKVDTIRSCLETFR